MPSFSKSKFRSRPRLLAVVKPCSLPPVGLPSESVTNVKVGVMPCSSSHVRVPYQSPSRCSRGRINLKGNGARERVPADASVLSSEGKINSKGNGPRKRVPADVSVLSSERVRAAQQQSMTITIRTQTPDFLCTTVYLLPFLAAFETAPSDLERLPRLFFSQTRKPPRNALSLSPARLPEGSSFSFFTLPPPRTTSSGSRAATRRFTTSVTKLRHFFLPYFFTPRIPT